MHCEVCGKTIGGKIFTINIEGARMQVCERCAKYGQRQPRSDSPSSKAKPMQMPSRPASATPRRPNVASSRPPRQQLTENLEAVENLGEILRGERQKRGMTQEEFGKFLLERASIITKIEAGRHTPPIATLKKFEHRLNIKLVTPRTKFDADYGIENTEESIRLGDIVKIKKKAEKEP